MLYLNWAPIVGALVITKKAWDELSPEGQAAVREAGAKAGMQMRAKARQEVDEAVEAMKKRGLTVNKPNVEQMKEWNELADKLYPRIRGKMVPADTFDEVVGHLKAYRAGKK
jgi:TRAP-type C4-dicarboxylate transport system substrate-binding protein